eukprot:Em0007g1501a
MSSKPLLIPEPFSGDCGNWQEWIDHFESVAVVNNKKELYVAELHTRAKRDDEDWASFGDALRVLSDRAYADLEERARERLALNQFLSQIENPQVAFGVKQKRPQNVEEAVTATIELESYLRSSGPITGKSHRVISVAQQQPAEDDERAEAIASVASSTENDLLGIINTISERLHTLESSVRAGRAQAIDREPGKRNRTVICWNCGRKGHIARFCRDKQQQENSNPSTARASQCLIDTGAAVSLLSVNTWQRVAGYCRVLPPIEKWTGQTLVGVNGSALSVKGVAGLPLSLEGNIFNVPFVVTDDILVEAILGLDFVESNHCVIDCGHRNLTFPSRRLSLKLLPQGSSKTEKNKNIAVGLILTQKVTIPPASEMEVMAALEDTTSRKGTWIVEGNRAGRYGVMVARSVVCPTSQAVPVRLLNPREESVVVRKGVQIARMEQLDDMCVGNVLPAPTSPSEASPKDRDMLWDMVCKVGNHVSSAEKEKLYYVLLEYSDVFSFSNDGLGRTSLSKHRINTGDSLPIHIPPRRIPHARREEVRKLLQDMLAKGAIQPSDSPWSSPIVLVTKKDGSTRFCVDYRIVNPVTRKDAYPLPLVDDTLDTLAGSKLFSTLDLATGYWQVEVADEDKEKTAFSTPEGLYQFEVMPFGLCNAPATFQRLMDKVLSGLKWYSCLVYIDDIVENHLYNLVGVLKRLREAGLKVKPSKCSLCQEKSKKNVFHWNELCQSAFDELRRCLVSSPVLAYPNYSKCFVLDTDTSDVGIGAVLSQPSEDGSERVIAYASRSLSRQEQRYCVTRRELLAVVEFTHHFRPYLLGRQFTLRTNHGSLVWLQNFKEPEGQLARWLERLQEFDFVVIHRQGTQHCNADALSRIPCSQCGRVDKGKEVEFSASMSPKPGVGKVVFSSRSGNFCVSKTACCGNGLDGNDGLQLVLPSKLQASAIRDLHEGAVGGHLGEEKVLSRLKEHFYWPGCAEAARNWCKSCLTCATRKMTVPKRKAYLQSIQSGYPMQLVSIDILGPVPVTEEGNKYVLAAVDHFTRWVEAFPIRNQEATTVARKLVDELFCRFSPPEQLHSDQGRQFESELIEEICKLLEIRKSRTTPYHPQGNGMVERCNRTLLDMLATTAHNYPSDWDLYIRKTTLPEYVQKLKDGLENAYCLVRERCEAEHKRQKSIYDEKVHGKPFNCGDLVWLYSPAVRVGTKTQCVHFDRLKPAVAKSNPVREDLVAVPTPTSTKTASPDTVPLKWADEILCLDSDDEETD